MKLLSIVFIISFSVLCPVAWCATTLTHPLNSQEIATQTFAPYGARAGKFENGKKITAMQPVVVIMTQSVSASNVTPRWSENISTIIKITPLKEVPTPAELDDLDDITSIGSDGSGQGTV